MFKGRTSGGKAFSAFAVAAVCVIGLSACDRQESTIASLDKRIAPSAGPTVARSYKSSYSIAGLRWGASPAEVTKTLKVQGFKVRKAKSGPALEYTMMVSWLDQRKVDRGKRMTAKGKFLGSRVTLDLVFGANDRLERISMKAPEWDGSTRSAKTMVASAQTFHQHLEKANGRAVKKEDPYGFVDMAKWSQARDGSRMELFIRAREGFMFFPKHKTVLVVNLWNDKFSDGRALIAKKAN